MFNRILVTLDGSKMAERALRPAAALAERFGSEVILLRVPVAEERVPAPVGAGLPADPLERSRLAAEAYLLALQTRWPGRAAGTRIETACGAEPAAAILHTARAEAVDLIVMSTHGRSGLGRLLYGSVAEAVLRDARVPVLLIPLNM